MLHLSAFLLTVVPPAADDIQWFALENNVSPAGNTVQFSVDGVWRNRRLKAYLFTPMSLTTPSRQMFKFGCMTLC